MEKSAKNRKRNQKMPVEDVISPKRPRKHSETRHPNSDGPNYFEQLPDEILSMITSYVPVRQWPQLQLLDHRFHRAIVASWRNLREADLTSFVDSEKLLDVGAYTRRRYLFTILQTLLQQSPNLESLDGFSPFCKTLERRCVRLLIQFRNLQKINFDCVVRVGDLAEFLSMTGSRGGLRDLGLDGALRYPERNGEERNDVTLREAISEIPGRPSLKLRRLVINGSSIVTGSFLDGLDVSELEDLSISNNEIHQEHLISLLSRCTLKTFEFRLDGFRPVSPIGYDYGKILNVGLLKAFGSLPSENLESLQISGLPRKFINFISATDLFGTVGLTYLGGRFRNVKTLIIRGNTLCDSRAVNTISENFVNLTKLHLDVSNSSSAALMRLAARLIKLENLVFFSAASQCLEINDSVIKAIGTNLKRIKKLGLSRPVISESSSEFLKLLNELNTFRIGGKCVTNKAVMVWSQDFGDRLETLSLHEAYKVTDSGMTVAAKKLINLREMELSGLRITDISLRAIASSCRRLRYLDIGSCPNITKSGVQAIINACEDLKILSLPGGLNFGRDDLNLNNRDITVLAD